MESSNFRIFLIKTYAYDSVIHLLLSGPRVFEEATFAARLHAKTLNPCSLSYRMAMWYVQALVRLVEHFASHEPAPSHQALLLL